MKKLLLIVVTSLLINFSLNAQSKIEGDTLYYGSSKYYVGKEIQMGYGTGTGKDFVYIQFGGGLSQYPAQARWSKSIITIDKIYKTQGKNYVRGKIKSLLMNKAFVDIEGAVDNKEILE